MVGIGIAELSCGWKGGVEEPIATAVPWSTHDDPGFAKEKLQEWDSVAIYRMDSFHIQLAERYSDTIGGQS